MRKKPNKPTSHFNHPKDDFDTQDLEELDSDLDLSKFDYLQLKELIRKKRLELSSKYLELESDKILIYGSDNLEYLEQEIVNLIKELESRPKDYIKFIYKKTL